MVVGQKRGAKLLTSSALSVVTQKSRTEKLFSPLLCVTHNYYPYLVRWKQTLKLSSSFGLGLLFSLFFYVLEILTFKLPMSITITSWLLKNLYLYQTSFSRSFACLALVLDRVLYIMTPSSHISFTVAISIQTVQNLHFLYKKSTLNSRENCRIFLGEKLVKMLWFLDFLTFGNFDFPRKFSIFFWVKNSWKCCGFWTF